MTATLPFDTLGEDTPLTVGDLRALLAQVTAADPNTSPVLTLREYCAQQMTALQQVKKSRFGSFRPLLRRLVEGTHATCECTCPACTSKAGCPCACSCEVVAGPDGTTVHHGRPSSTVPHALGCTGRAGECSARWTGCGDLPMDQVTVADLELAQAAVRRAANAFNLRADRSREAKGQPPKEHDGRGAATWYVRAVRWLFGRAVDDGIIIRDVSQRLRKPETQEAGPRSLDPDQVMEAIALAGSTGDDPALGGLVATFFFVTGARSGGVVTSRFGRLNVEEATMAISEPKRDGARHTVAIPPDVAKALHRHALERGPRTAAPAGAPEAVRRAGIPALSASDPLLYREPVDEFDANGYFLRRTVRPITIDTVDNIRVRICKNLPWAQDMWLRWHDFRHTIGTMLDRVAGHAVAEYHLGHKTPPTTTSIYTKAGLAEDAAAIALLFNCDHPLAPPRTAT